MPRRPKHGPTQRRGHHAAEGRTPASRTGPDREPMDRSATGRTTARGVGPGRHRWRAARVRARVRREPGSTVSPSTGSDGAPVPTRRGWVRAAQRGRCAPWLRRLRRAPSAIRTSPGGDGEPGAETGEPTEHEADESAEPTDGARRRADEDRKPDGEAGAHRRSPSRPRSRSRPRARPGPRARHQGRRGPHRLERLRGRRRRLLQGRPLERLDGQVAGRRQRRARRGGRGRWQDQGLGRARTRRQEGLVSRLLRPPYRRRLQGPGRRATPKSITTPRAETPAAGAVRHVDRGRCRWRRASSSTGKPATATTFSHYRILRKADGDATVIAEIESQDTTTFVDDDVEPGVTYRYLVQCKGHVGDDWFLLGTTEWVGVSVE